MPSRFLPIVGSMAVAFLLTVTPLFPQQTPGLLEGQRLYEAGRFPEAEAAFQAEIRNAPKSAIARYWLGMALFEQRRDKEALNAFDTAVKLDRRLTDAHVGMGRTYLRINKQKEARKAFEKAVELHPDNAQVHYYLGLSYIEKVRLADIRRGKVKEAFKNQHDAFQRAIQLDPQHPDAYYRLGLAYETLLEDPAVAMPFFFKQASVNFAHREALRHLSQSCMATQQYEQGVDFFTQLEDRRDPHADPMLAGFAAQIEACYYQAKKQEARAFNAYETFLAALDKTEPEEAALYRDLSLVAPEDIVREYQGTSQAEKAEVWRRFWAPRDPDPTTGVNERLTEHYRRVMFARQYFSGGQQPWDRRGEIYIRYGEPDDRQRFAFRSGSNVMDNYMPTGNTKVDAVRETNRYQYQLQVDNGSAPWAEEDAGMFGQFLATADRETRNVSYATESWVYVPYGLELFFTDQMSNGKYDFPLLPTRMPSQTGNFGLMMSPGFRFMTTPEQRAANLIKQQPESYRFNYGGDPLAFVFDLVSFKGSDGAAQIEVAYSIPSNQLGAASDGHGMETWFNSRVALQDEALRHVLETAATTGPISRPLNEPSKNQIELRTAAFSFQAPAGTYRSSLAVRDSTTQRIGIFLRPFTVRNFTTGNLQVSDIKLSTAITPQAAPGPFTRNGLHITPHPAHIYPQTQPVYLYYEVYNLRRNPEGRTSYQTTLEITAKEKQRGFASRLLSGIGNLVARSSDDGSVLLTFEDAGAGSDEYKYTSIDTTELPGGAYTLTLTLTDLNSGQKTTASTDFVIATH